MVERWIKVLGFVRSAPGFGMQPAVLNGFSDLIIEVYGIERASLRGPPSACPSCR